MVTAAGPIADDLDQSGFAFRFGWGREGLDALAPACDVIVIVDVLRFTTAVGVATEQGAMVLPYPRLDAAPAYASAHDAVLAGRRRDGPVSLSPTDMLSARAGARIVLPSPNGSTLSFAARELGAAFVLAGCFRNARATARRAAALANGGPIGVIAAGERWASPDGPLRPCVEDLLGAGAVIAALDPAGAIAPPHSSPEAAAARVAFLSARPLLLDALVQSGSGRELQRLGCGDDIETAAHLDVTDRAAQLVDDAFVAV